MLPAQKLRVVVLLPLLSFLGCVSTSFKPENTAVPAGPLAVIAPSSVKLLSALPRTPYQTIGQIEANLSGFPSDEAVLRRVREKAASVGANAVVYTSAGRAFMANAAFASDKAKITSVSFVAIRVGD